MATQQLNLWSVLYDVQSQRAFIRMFISACDRLEWPTEPYDTNVVYQSATKTELPPRHDGYIPSKYTQALQAEMRIQDDTPALKYARVRERLVFVSSPENTSANALGFAVVLILMLYKEIRLLVSRHTEPNLGRVFFYNFEKSINEIILGYVVSSTTTMANRTSIKAIKAASTPAEYLLDVKLYYALLVACKAVGNMP